MRLLKNRDWFDKGGRHSVGNRIDDFSRILDRADLSRCTALDAGAAEGDISIWLANRFAHVTAIELMQTAFEKLKTKTSKIKNIEVSQADIFKIALKEYDIVFLLGVLHYFFDDSEKDALLSKVVEKAKYGCFVRTGTREHRLRDGYKGEKAAKYTPYKIFEDVAVKADCDWFLVDNSYRGKDGKRLGDLIVYRHRVPNNPLPTVDEMKTLVPGAVG